MKIEFFEDQLPPLLEALDFLRDTYPLQRGSEIRFAQSTLLELITGMSRGEVGDGALSGYATHSMFLAYQLAYGAKLYEDERRAYYSIVLHSLAVSLMGESGMNPSARYKVHDRGWQTIVADRFCDTSDDH